MATFEHEFLVALLREHPDLLLSLLRRGVGVAQYADIEVLDSSESLSVLHPPERRADAVLVLRDAEARPMRAIVVEVQLAIDARKRWSWPVYVAVARARLGCPVNLVVVAFDRKVALWCGMPIVLDDQGSALRPRVLGAASVPVADHAVAARHPELAVLSLLAHREEPAALGIGRAILSACGDLDEEHAQLYADIVFSFVSEAVRRTLEAEMNLANYEVQSPFLRELKAKAEAEGRARGVAQGLAEGVAQGLAQGLAEGLAQGLAQGLAEGVVQGLARGLATAVLSVLDGRGVEITEAERTTIESCTDVEQLQRWLVLAVTAASAAEMLRA